MQYAGYLYNSRKIYANDLCIKELQDTLNSILPFFQNPQAIPHEIKNYISFTDNYTNLVMHQIA